MSEGTSTTVTSGPRTASLLDTARVTAQVVLPTLAVGVIARRPRMMAAAERIQADRKAVAVLQELRSRYGDGPLLLRVPGRTVAVVLAPEHVHRILSGSPELFTPANREKQTALGHFQPHGVLLSRGRERAQRREFHEEVLETDRPVHDLGSRITSVVREEAQILLEETTKPATLDWSAFAHNWWRIVRRIVLGDRARHDQALTTQLDMLRSDANWAFLHPRRRSLRRHMRDRLAAHLQRREPGTLAEQIAASETSVTAPEEQVPHWLFAFDAAGMTAFRTLALLASHPQAAAAARQECADLDLAEPHPLRYLRACVQESLRLWPTTPALLRDGVSATSWGSGSLPKGTAFVMYTPYFHRDETTIDFAHTFTPDAWLDGRAEQQPALVPFSAGPGRCPGENLVQFVTSTLLACLLQGARFQPSDPPEPDLRAPLPATFDPFTARLRLSP